MKRKIAATAVVAAAWSVLLCPVALAYIDASGTSMLLNAIIGILIAGGAAVAVYWHKLKRWFKKKRKARMKARNAAGVTVMQEQAASSPESTSPPELH